MRRETALGAGAGRLRPIGIRRSRDGIEVAVEGGVGEEWLGRAIWVLCLISARTT